MTGVTGVTDILELVEQGLLSPELQNDPDISHLVGALQRRFGKTLSAVLLYGSYLRGKRDTLLDFYVLLHDFEGVFPSRWQRLGNVLLPPNVYYLALGDETGSGTLRAKYATMSLAQFERANATDFHSYFWARFAQPCRLVFCRDEDTRRRVVAGVAAAVQTFTHRVSPMLQAPFDAKALWVTGLNQTYRAELRAEGTNNLQALYDNHAQHLRALAGACLPVDREGLFSPPDAPNRLSASIQWWLRRAVGKVLSVLRLLKAAGTFDDPLDYALWKIQRHSGIFIEPTERQRRYPLMFAWPLLWRLYRRGAFR